MEDKLKQGKVWHQAIENELLGNILPFWIRHAKDAQHGGFVGALSNDLKVDPGSPRSAILTARILWTYAAAYRLYRRPEFLAMAGYACDTLRATFFDPLMGGVYWTVDSTGKARMDRKHTYAQSFAIYGLAEYTQAAGKPEALAQAQEIFGLLERHAHDPIYGGYIEGCARDWSALADMRLSDREPVCQKSMNTMLHVMEGFTNLLRVWDDALLRARLRECIQIFLERIIDPDDAHLRLFFDDEWNSLAKGASYGHDIEGAWLLLEAVEVLGEPELIDTARAVSQSMAQAVLDHGLWPDGSVIYEQTGGSHRSQERQWWTIAEGMVGLYNAYQLSGKPAFAEAAYGCWEFAERSLVDREHGDWFKVLDGECRPRPDSAKIGPWECPYHHSRACMEMMKRIEP